MVQNFRQSLYTKKGADDMTKIPERNNGAALIAKVALEEAFNVTWKTGYIQY